MNQQIEISTKKTRIETLEKELNKSTDSPSKFNQTLIDKISGMTTNEKKKFARESHENYEQISKEKTLAFVRVCIALSEASKDLKHGEKEAWYLSDFKLKKRAAQKRILVAEKLARFKNAHLDAFSPSQLIRIAAIKNDNAIAIIITNKIKLTSNSLEKLKANFETVIGLEEDREQIKMKIESFYKSHDDQIDPDENGDSDEIEDKDNSSIDAKNKTSGKGKQKTKSSKAQMILIKCQEVKKLMKAFSDGISYVEDNIANSEDLLSHLKTLLKECGGITKAASGAIKKIEAATKVSKGGKNVN